ncbi:hypothetical protein HHI36_003075 [Cryptolaemus montrouzieri]|uniref:Prostaglandin reductase 1 n=1 Tax=Cryptolaemus montrouzieri TaxID=559131 RepID=A0ABD2PD77_9CUCU
MKAKKYVLRNQFVGFPKKSDVEMVEEELPPLKEGEFLCESLYISIDPYQRAYLVEVGNVVLGSQVARILESRNSKFPCGRYVIAYYGWKTHGIIDETSAGVGFPPRLIQDPINHPISYYLGVLGMPGATAYFGFLEICHPKPGETIVVSGAAGAVGHVVGQIAKIKGCKVIGIVGSEEKGRWITEDLKFDGYINYKLHNISKTLAALAPEGVDCYFDNVGGEISNDVMKQMNLYGRISVCGAISSYNSIEEDKASIVQKTMIFKELNMEGFRVFRWLHRFEEVITQHGKWLAEGKLKTKETITKGFENTFQAFTGMLNGSNFGKAIVEL